MPKIAWSKELTGTGRCVLVGGDAIFLQLGPEDTWRQEGNATYHTGEKGTPEVHCFALDGTPRWRRLGARLLARVGDDRVLVTGTGGDAIVLDTQNKIVTKHKFPARLNAAKIDGNDLILSDGHRLYLADSDLTIHRQLPWPDKKCVHLENWLGGAFYWDDGYQLKTCKNNGPVEVLVPSFRTAMLNAAKRFEAETGSELAFVNIANNEKTLASDDFENGKDWFPRPLWMVSSDPLRRLLFLTNRTLPHFLICIEVDERRIRWCRVLSDGCCSDSPHRVSDGKYVTSSGCGGVLSWLDAEGNLLAQSKPIPGDGWYGQLHVLTDDRCMVHGGPGMIGYEADMNRIWALNEHFSTLSLDPAKTLAAGYNYPQGTSKPPVTTVLKVLTGL